MFEQSVCEVVVVRLTPKQACASASPSGRGPVAGNMQHYNRTLGAHIPARPILQGCRIFRTRHRTSHYKAAGNRDLAPVRRMGIQHTGGTRTV